MQETLFNSSKQFAEKKSMDAPELLAVRMFKSDDARIAVNSQSILGYTSERYGSQRRNIGTIEYDSKRIGRLTGDDSAEELPFPYNFRTTQSPRPFIPRLSHDYINTILSISIQSKYLIQLEHGENIRYENREIWGTDVYTDDSDILLVLQHCGVLPASVPNKNRVNYRTRTPGNISNPDLVVGTVPEGNLEFEIQVDIILLPPLKSYASCTRNDITSREWTGQIHDGLSYAIHAVTIKPIDKTLENIDQSSTTKKLQW